MFKHVQLYLHNILTLMSDYCILAYEQPVLPWYVSKQCILCCLARDHGAECARATYMLCQQLLAIVGTELSDRSKCICVKCISHCSSPICVSEKFFPAISSCGNATITISCYHSWLKGNKYISPKRKSFCYLPLLQLQLFRP